MINMAGLAGMVELGFSAAISRTASYFLGGAAQVPSLGGIKYIKSLQGINYAGLVGLIVMSKKLYRNFAIVVGLLLLFGGGIWLAVAKPGSLHDSESWTAFVIVGFGTAFNMSALFWWPLLFGLNHVREYNRLQFNGIFFSYLFTFIGLHLGAGLPALAIGNFLLNYIPRHISRQRVLEIIPKKEMKNLLSINWRQLWPITWRAGMVSLSCYFMLNVTLIACAQLFDLSTTARYGLCLQFGLMLHALSQSWVAVKYPLLSALRTQGRSKEFNKVVYQRIALSLLTYIIGSYFVLLLATPFMQFIHSNTMPLPIEQFSCILLLTGADLFINLLAAVMITSENATPHLYAYIISGVGVTITCFALGSLYGIWGIVLAPLLVQTCFNYWWVPSQCWRILQRHIMIPAT